MDLGLLNRGLDLARKKRKWVFLLAAFGITGYGVYRVYNSPSVVRKRKKFYRLLSALVSIAESVSDSAETFGILSKDLREFLQSDSDEIPNSLKQISKIAQSKEFSDSVVRVTASLTRGVLRGYQAESREIGSGVESGSGFYDRFMDKLFSNAGSGFASVVIGSFARNLVLAFFSNGESDAQLNLGAKLNVEDSVSTNGSLPRWVDVTCDDRYRELIGGWIQMFVSTAVAVYLDRTVNINTYDEFFAGLTNPKHEKQVRDLLVSVCSGSIETLVKTSHQVLTSSNSDVMSESACSDVSSLVVTHSKSDVGSKTLYPPLNDVQNVISVNHNRHGRGIFFNIKEARRESSCESGQTGWISTVSSTLAVPSNRKFVLDVTGRVTFETVRSFLEVLLEKVFTGVKRSARAVNEATVDRGLQAVRYVTAKASVVAAICLSLCLHVLDDTRALMPA